MHSTFGSSRLVRLVGRWTSVDTESQRRDFAERLGAWLSLNDVVALHDAQQAIRAPAEGGATTPGPEAAAALCEEVQRIRASIEKSITEDDGPSARGPDAGYAPYHQRYLYHQRRMTASVGALRDRVRQALQAASPRLARLAALDTALDQTLNRREQQLLFTVPVSLKQRFEQLQGENTDQGALLPPSAWIDSFLWELKETLLAELEVRLQPVLGMLEALQDEADTNR